MAGGRVRDGEPSPRQAAPADVDPVIALVSLVGTSVRAWDPRDASVDAVVDRIVRQILAVSGVYGAYLRDVSGDRVDVPRSAPRERPPADHEELSWPIGTGPSRRQLLVHIAPGLQNDTARTALGAVASTLDTMLRWHATGEARPAIPPEAAKEIEALRRTCVQRGVLLENNRAIVLVVQSDCTWHSVSAAFTRVLGYPRHVATTHKLDTFIHPEDRAAAHRGFAESLAGRSPAEAIDIRARAADGRWVILSVVFRDLIGEPGVDAVVAYCLDVTAQREVERRWQTERARLAQLVATMTSGVVVEDGFGRVAIANEAVAQLLGSPADLLGASWPATLDKLKDVFADPAGFSALAEHLRSVRKPVVGEELALADERVLELDFAPITGESTDLGALWHFRDITERAAAHRNLEERNRSLAELAELRNVFVATVSHELRTPLTSVVSFAHLLQEDTAETLSGYQQQCLDGIDRNANRLLRLIEDLLLLVRLETHNLPLTFTVADPPELVRAAVTDREPIAAERGISLRHEVRDGPPLECDEGRLHQVLGNLLGNALKYTPAGGSVTVRAAPDETGWQFDVADTGIGIPAADVDRVFSSFTRASNAGVHGAPGTGLGLVISQAIVSRHGGSIALQSTEGVGTTVTVHLPYKQPPSGEVR
jgi:PAS domain S-box-containing protein